MRIWTGIEEAGPEFSIQSAVNVQTFPMTYGACIFGLSIDTSQTPSARRNSPQYPGRKEVVSVVIELVLGGSDVIEVFRPKVEKSVISLGFKQCSTIDFGRRLYRELLGPGSDTIDWRVWCPIGLSMEMYRSPVRMVTPIQ